MKVALLQMNVVRRDAVANIATAERLLQRAGKADLYVLPEMWATGFDVHPDESTFSAGEQGLAWMREAAVKCGCSVAGSLPVLNEKHKAVNRFFCCSAGHDVVTYDKRHPFSPGGEAATYKAGQQMANFPLAGMTIRPLICYDLRFPVFSRCRHGDYDVLLYVANWPAVRMEAWRILLQARAIENQCYVIGVNRTGRDGRLLYNGGSMVVDPTGQVLLCMDEAEDAAVVELQPEHVATVRRNFPVLNDADDFALQLK